RAAELKIAEIELRFSGEKAERPLEIASPRLTLRAGVGYEPALVIRPGVQLEPRQMIRMVGGGSAHLAWQGVELRLELPRQAPADGFALFAVNTGQSLDRTSGVRTGQDGDED